MGKEGYYFHRCHNMQELRDEFRRLCKTLHPDVGGDKYKFGEMKRQYDTTLHDIKSSKPLPAYFDRNKSYQYFYQPIIYKTRDAHYHIFERQSGCEVWIDQNNIHLIYEKQIRI